MKARHKNGFKNFFCKTKTINQLPAESKHYLLEFVLGHPEIKIKIYFSEKRESSLRI